MSMNTNEVVDDRPDNDFDDDGRGIPQVGRKKGPSKIWYLVIAGVIAVLLFALAASMLMNKLANRGIGAKKGPTAVVTADQGVAESAFNRPSAPPPLPQTMQQPVQPAPVPACLPGQIPTPEVPCIAPGSPQPASVAAQPAGPTPEQQAAMDLAERRKRAPVMANVQMSGGSGGGDGGDGGMETTGNSRGNLGQSLQATRMGAVSATQLQDPNMTITQGRLLPCTLETAISSQVSGMTSCVLTRDIYSTNGRVMLLERGTRIVGQYESGRMRQGMSRIFVLWTRAETPNGVLINLDSPAADTLGRSGVDGKINTHFWTRFGSALLLSLVDDAAQYAIAVQQAKKANGGTTVQLGNTTNSSRDAANIIVENTVNIPPTLEKPQGSSIGVFVARDLYFGDVYRLQPTGARANIQ